MTIKLLKGVALAIGLLLALIVLWLGIVSSHWFPPPTAAELQALALLNSDAGHVHGKANAFAALYLLDRDVPESKWEEIALADATVLSRYDSNSDLSTLAVENFPQVTRLTGDDAKRCSPRATDCLDSVRRGPDATRAAVAKARKLLDRGERLAAYDHYHSLVRMQLDTPFPIALGDYAMLALSEAALLHIDGNSEAALKKLCGFSSTWRTLRANSDSLLVSMLGTSYVGGAASLRAGILAEMPSPFNAPCPETFAPLVDAELDLCPEMADEFQIFKQTVGDLAASQRRKDEARFPSIARLSYRLLNVQHAIRFVAPKYARYCHAPDQGRPVAQRFESNLEHGCPSSVLFFSPYTCLLVPVSAAPYESYYLRGFDLDAQLRLLATAQWLRQQSDDELEIAFADRPDDLRSPSHDFEIDVENQRLRISLLGRTPSEVWEIPYASSSSAARDGDPSDSTPTRED